VLIGNGSAPCCRAGSVRDYCHRYRYQAMAPGRPRSPLEVADARELARIAGLAASVLSSIRRPGRGVWESERDLRSWLAADEVSFTSSDLAPALGLLEATGKIGRHAARANTPRAGWLIVNSDGASSSAPEAVGDAQSPSSLLQPQAPWRSPRPLRTSQSSLTPNVSTHWLQRSSMRSPRVVDSRAISVSASPRLCSVNGLHPMALQSMRRSYRRH
jgi:hypothetical protein